MVTDIIAPKAIQAGDTFGIFSPSEPLTADRVKRMQPSLELLENRFNYVFAQHARNERGYVAATTAECIADIIELLTRDDVHVLIASMGGKNSNRLVRELPYSTFVEQRKPIVGFSDVCVLLNAITAVTGLITFYGPNIVAKLVESNHADLGLLCGNTVPPFGYTASEHWQTLLPGTASGRLYGGSLSTFVLGLAGSAAMPAMVDPIFFWETSTATPQIIDQYLTTLRNCGFLERIKAMIVGDVSYTEIPRRERPVNELLIEYGEELGIPVVRIGTFGHHPMENPAIPIGAEVHLDTQIKTITLKSEVVESV